MRLSNRLHKLVSLLVISTLSSLSFYAPVVQATLVGTPAVLGVTTLSSTGERAHVLSLLQRQDVMQQLQTRGVDPAQVQARVNVLSDPEVHALAMQLDKAPAGAGGLELVLLVFVVLLLTDIAGITHIFTFVR